MSIPKFDWKTGMSLRYAAVYSLVLNAKSQFGDLMCFFGAKAGIHATMSPSTEQNQHMREKIMKTR